MPKPTINVEMTSQEAHTVLRALATANGAVETLRGDIEPNTWVANRIIALLAAQDDADIAAVHRLWKESR